MESIQKHAQPGISMILVGNKCDLKDERRIFESEAKKLAAENKMNYYDVSAKENLNIDEVFQDLMEQVAKRRMGGGATEEPKEAGVRLDAKKHDEQAATADQKKKGCC